MTRSGASRHHAAFALLLLLTLAVAGWFVRHWYVARQQRAQEQELPAALLAPAPGPVLAYGLRDTVPVGFVRYGTVLYRLQQGKSVPDPLPGESRVAAYDYEPDSRPWLRRATGFAGRNPHMAVLVREFSSDTALQAALQRPLNGFVCEYQDSRGIELWRRREPVAFEANFVARVRHDTMVWEYDTTDDPIGVRMVAAAGFRYGGTAADRAQPVP